MLDSARAQMEIEEMFGSRQRVDNRRDRQAVNAGTAEGEGLVSGQQPQRICFYYVHISCNC